MSLVQCPKHTKADLACWKRLEAYDRRLVDGSRFARSVQSASDEIKTFADQGGCYCGVSWGKDSVVVAHLVRTVAPDVPLVWVRVEPIKNPHCGEVRDRFLERWPGPYWEVEEHCRRDADGWHATGTLERGFKEAVRRCGSDRHISGIRGEESGPRKMRMLTHGCSTVRTCAPIGWWKCVDVFTYLAKFDLPVHPAYAMTWGGRLDRCRLRVSSIGGRRGDGTGRIDWERRYYPESPVWRD